MNPMTRLLLAAAAFLIAHYVSSTPLRPRLVRLLGANGYVLLYSAVAFATLGGMAWAYYRAPYLGLWHVPALRYAPLAIMPLALILVVCGVLMRNPRPSARKSCCATARRRGACYASRAIR